MRTLLRNIAARVACVLDKHVCTLASLRRINDERVEATCSRCGRVLHAPFGLAINCRWTKPLIDPARLAPEPADRD